jgi:hypothetical protein
MQDHYLLARERSHDGATYEFLIEDLENIYIREVLQDLARSYIC